MTPLWTAADAANATGGRATGDWQANGISIDTREIRPGDLFVALKDVRDGHDFVAQALAKGAAAAMVSRIPDGVPEDAPLLLVDDVLAALERLGIAGRARSRARVIGITGSVGKTSTKEMLRAVLAGQGRVHAAEKSFNNHWGVPVTLARLPQDADFAVVEIGMNHPGEIAPLARMARPHVAIITTIAAAHLHAFDNLDGIAREKAAILDGLEPGGTAIVHGDLAQTPILTEAAKLAGARIRTFGQSSKCHDRITEIVLGGDATIARARLWRTPVLYKIASPGRHFAVNAAAVLGAVKALNLDIALAITDLGQWQPPSGRGTREELALDAVDHRQKIDLIDDAFNANPASMAAALDVLAVCTPVDGVGRIYHGRRIAILGDMLELGPDETRLHTEIAKLPSLQSLDLVHCVGPRMKALYNVLPEGQRGRWTRTAPELASQAYTLFDAGDVLLVKGSKGIKVSLVVDAIRKLGHPLLTETEGRS